MKNRIKDLIKVEIKMTVTVNSVFHNHLAQDQKWLLLKNGNFDQIFGLHNDHLVEKFYFSA